MERGFGMECGQDAVGEMVRGGSSGHEMREVDGPECDARAEEEGAEFFDSTGDALFGGGFAGADAGGDFVERAFLEVEEDECGAIGGGEAGEVSVEEGAGFAEFVGLGGHFHGVCPCGLNGGAGFADLAAAVCAAGFTAGVAGDAEEPGAQGLARGDAVGFLGEDEEDGLGDVFGGGGILKLAACGGVDEVEVLADEGFEGGGVAAGGPGSEKLLVGGGHLLINGR